MTERTPSPTRPLSPRAQRLWRELLAEHDFQRFELEVLARALEMSDRADEMSDRIARDGLVVGDKPHPLLSARRDALLASARFWRQLKFTDPSKPAPRIGRPPKGVTTPHLVRD